MSEADMISVPTETPPPTSDSDANGAITTLESLASNVDAARAGEAAATPPPPPPPPPIVSSSSRLRQQDESPPRRQNHDHPPPPRPHRKQPPPSPLLLSKPSDPTRLSEVQCLVRSQIEVFVATPQDVEARYHRGGSKTSMAVGRVGIRCVHCSHLPAQDRVKGAVSYPRSVRIVYQAARNWQRYHLPYCQHIPAEVAERYQLLKSGGGGRAKAKGGGSFKHAARGVACDSYWIECCEAMGLVDAPNGSGIVFADPEEEEDCGAGGGRRRRTGGITNSLQSAACCADRLGRGVDDSGSNDGADDDDEKKTEGVVEEEEERTHYFDSDFDDLSVVSADAGQLFAHDDEEDGALFAAPTLSSVGGGATAPSAPEAAAAPDDGFGASPSIAGFRRLDISGGDRSHGCDDGVDAGKPIASSNEGVPLQDERGGGGGSQQRDRLLERVRLAYETLKTTRDLRHVPQQQPQQQSGIKESDGEANGRNSDDASSLGVELYELFAQRPFQYGDHDSARSVASLPLETGDSGVEGRQKKRRDGRRSGGGASPDATCVFVALREMGLPFSLCNLISGLLYPEGGDSAAARPSAQDVEEDLRAMTADPDRFLFDPPDVGAAPGGKIQPDFPSNVLFGRRDEAERLMEAYTRVLGLREGAGAAREIVLLSGYSGTGKSSLADQVRAPLEEQGGYFVAGKFDALKQVRPLSTIADAFNRLCDVLLMRDAEELERTRVAIREAVGSDGMVLTNLIPRLTEVINTPDDESSVSGKEAWNRLAFCFRRFVRAISTPSHPVILFVDDLQWADEASLDLLQQIITDDNIKSFLFLGAYRDNEIDANPHLTTHLRNIEGSGISITTINLANLDRESINALISYTLRLPPRLTSPLTNLVKNKTSGNPLFAVQFLRSLCDEELLRYSLVSHRWEWDMDAIQSKNIEDDVVQLMTSKMLKLPPNVQWGLKVASCLGSEMDEGILKLLDIDETNAYIGTVDDLLNAAVEEGLMNKVGSTYKFSHDQIQHAAYSLIPENEQASIHLHIGRSLWKRASDNNLDSLVYIIVDQLQRGSNLISDKGEKIELAKLFLMAAKKSISSSAFLPASIYLVQGICLLDESDWDSHYQLSLELFSCCVETFYVIGNFNGIKEMIKPIFAHGRCFQDTFRAYYILINSLGAEGKNLDAIVAGLRALEQLGEPFPNEVSKIHVEQELSKIKEILRSTTTESILKGNIMDDASKIAAMRILCLLTVYAFVSKHELTPLIVSRMVKLSLVNGLCSESSYAFGSYGMLLCGSGDIQSAYYFGKLALSILEKFRATSRNYRARVYGTVFGLINNFTEPIQATYSKLKYGYEEGMSSGDVEWAMGNVILYVMAATQSGAKLEPLADEVRAYLRQMEERQQHNFVYQMLPYFQAVLNLMGSSVDPIVLDGEAMKENEFLNTTLERRNQSAVAHFYYVRMWLAYMFGNYDIAIQMATRRMNVRTKSRNATIVGETFYTGLIAVAVARADPASQGKWRRIASENIEKMKAWASHSAWNFQHKLELLCAETARLDGKTEIAAKAYDDAIKTAADHRFLHEQALACERAGIFYSESGNPQFAKKYYARSHQLYLEWGAKRKASDILKFL